jgi:HEAT repeat protein
MSGATFAQAFERLVVLFRDTPKDTAEHGRAAVEAANAAAGLTEPARFEAGFERGTIQFRTTLRGRMLERAVDWLEVYSEVSLADLGALARALASDDLPLQEARGIRLALVPLPVPVEPEPVLRVSGAYAALNGEEDLDDDPELQERIETVSSALNDKDWHRVADAAVALVDYADQPSERRRLRLIAARRVLGRPVLDQLLDHALRRAEDQAAVAQVLARIGPEGHEVMVHGIADSESLAARRFLHDRLAETPDALPLLLPLLQRGKPHQVRHAAGLLGRLSEVQAVPALAAASRHFDEATRSEVLRALAVFEEPMARSALADALTHASPATRIAAAAAIGMAGRVSLSPALMSALRDEKDPSVRRALATAAARIGTVEAMEELVRTALARRRMLGRGEPVEMRLDIVAGLAAANTPEARRCLDRLAREADRRVSEAADQALSVRRSL